MTGESTAEEIAREIADALFAGQGRRAEWAYAVRLTAAALTAERTKAHPRFNGEDITVGFVRSIIQERDGAQAALTHAEEEGRQARRDALDEAVAKVLSYKDVFATLDTIAAAIRALALPDQTGSSK